MLRLPLPFVLGLLIALAPAPAWADESVDEGPPPLTETEYVYHLLSRFTLGATPTLRRVFSSFEMSVLHRAAEKKKLWSPSGSKALSRSRPERILLSGFDSVRRWMPRSQSVRAGPSVNAAFSVPGGTR